MVVAIRFIFHVMANEDLVNKLTTLDYAHRAKKSITSPRSIRETDEICNDEGLGKIWSNDDSSIQRDDTECGLASKLYALHLHFPFKLPNGIGNASLRRLISGALGGAVSRTCVAPLETSRAYLMVGSSGHSTTEVAQDIMQTRGWTGLFRGNFVNVICVAPSKAIEISVLSEWSKCDLKGCMDVHFENECDFVQ
ncbi:adenine nucleotide transporter BT1, chloroplastic/mitochondrial-like protein [Tanacetum coccineum]